MPACNRKDGEHGGHVIGRKYVDAVRLAGGLPLVVPAAQAHEIAELLALADGVCLTGSPSNVHPRHFGEVVRDLALPLDTARDDWTLPLIPRVLALGIPLFAICRGFQEMNVALGGSLHQAVQEQPDFKDHRARDDRPVAEQYGPAHAVQVVNGGVLDTLLGTASFQVNSLHGQGIKRLAEGLRIEATAPDGVIEAVSLPGASGFNLGVQWHPEWQAGDNPVSMKLLRAFGDACRAYCERRHGTPGQR
jgi:putative glutamine amidotransferase